MTKNIRKISAIIALIIIVFLGAAGIKALMTGLYKFNYMKNYSENSPIDEMTYLYTMEIKKQRPKTPPGDSGKALLKYFSDEKTIESLKEKFDIQIDNNYMKMTTFDKEGVISYTYYGNGQETCKLNFEDANKNCKMIYKVENLETKKMIERIIYVGQNIVISDKTYDSLKEKQNFKGLE